jgi:seryl-tRNA synthetase
MQLSSIQEALDKNPQADVGPFLRKEFDFSKLRADLNTLNSAFDEETQRGTDRLIRNILQDITKLETANKQKEGVERSGRRLDIMKSKLAKLSQAFADYLAFAA